MRNDYNHFGEIEQEKQRTWFARASSRNLCRFDLFEGGSR